MSKQMLQSDLDDISLLSDICQSKCYNQTRLITFFPFLKYVKANVAIRFGWYLVLSQICQSKCYSQIWLISIFLLQADSLILSQQPKAEVVTILMMTMRTVTIMKEIVMTISSNPVYQLINRLYISQYRQTNEVIENRFKKNKGSTIHKYQ